MLQEFAEELENTCMEALNEVHTVLPAEVTKVNVNDSTVNVQPIGSYYADEEDEEPMEYPEIADVPIMFPSMSEKCGMVFPISKGDTVLLLVSECELDEFLDEEESVGSLRFDLSSAIAIPGLLRKLPTSFKDAVTKKAVIINNGSTSMEISSSEVKINGKLTLNGDLNLNGELKSEEALVIDGNFSTTGSFSAGGSISAGGDITTSGNMTANGVGLSSHIHVDRNGYNTSTGQG